MDGGERGGGAVAARLPLLGKARLHPPGDPVYEEATRRVFAEDGRDYPARGVVVLEVERARPFVSPGYDRVPDEDAMRAAWKPKRAALDDAFDAHVRRRGPFRPPR